MSSLVKDLWDNVPKPLKVSAGAPPKAFVLDPDISSVYTTVECFGCTAVILCSGRMVLIAHFAEISGPAWNFLDDQAFVTTTPLEAALAANEALLGPNPLAIIFTLYYGYGPSFLYSKRIQGGNSIQASINNDFAPVSMDIVGYLKLVDVDDRFDDTSAGKLVVEWRAPNSACGSNGVGILNIYAKDNWLRNAHFDVEGNPVAADGTACTI